MIARALCIASAGLLGFGGVAARGHAPSVARRASIASPGRLAAPFANDSVVVTIESIEGRQLFVQRPGVPGVVRFTVSVTTQGGRVRSVDGQRPPNDRDRPAAPVTVALPARVVLDGTTRELRVTSDPANPVTLRFEGARVAGYLIGSPRLLPGWDVTFQRSGDGWAQATLVRPLQPRSSE